MSSFLGGGSFYVVLHLGRPLMRNLGPECSISPDCQASLRAQALPTKLLHSGALDRLVDCVDLKLRVACSKQSLLLSGPMGHMMDFFPPQPYNRASAPLCRYNDIKILHNEWVEPSDETKPLEIFPMLLAIHFKSVKWKIFIPLLPNFN